MIELFVEFTTECNFDCKMFCNNSKTKKTTINISDIKGIESLLARSKFIDITGYGEIMTHPNFEHIISFLSAKKIPIRIVTNGYMLYHPKIRETIIKSTIFELVISINSLNPSTHELFSNRPASLSKVLIGIDHLIKEGFSNKKIQFSFVMNKYNFDEVKSFIDLGNKYGIHVACLGLTPTIKYERDISIPDTTENREKIKEYYRYAKEKNTSFFIFNFDNQVGAEKRNTSLSESIKNCKWIYEKFFISATGNVGPCCWNNMIMGNILNESFDEIWNGPKYTELRERVKNGDLKYCQNCRKDG